MGVKILLVLSQMKKIGLIKMNFNCMWILLLISQIWENGLIKVKLTKIMQEIW
jgi:hypothetical protein